MPQRTKGIFFLNKRNNYNGNITGFYAPCMSSFGAVYGKFSISREIYSNIALRLFIKN